MKIPIVELGIDGDGSYAVMQKTSKGLVGREGSLKLLYKGHTITEQEENTHLEVELEDSSIPITVTAKLTLVGSLPIVRSSTSITNNSSRPLMLNHLSSLIIPCLTAPSAEWWSNSTLSIAHNAWFREVQWQECTLPSLGLDSITYNGFGIDRPEVKQPAEGMGQYSLSNRSTFSTMGHLPMGMLKTSDDEVWAWQIENNGAWRWDIGDMGGRLYLVTSGPEANDHDWRLRLDPSSEYTTPYTAIYRGDAGNVDAAFQALTAYRRTIIRPHPGYDTLPIIFNDYMNCLMGDPTDEKILALLEPVRKSGAEYFVIDAGWYADDGNWWDDVGKWEPSVKRFPMGFKELLRKIEEAGLKPGLWVEPEVIGVRCELAETLPKDAFLQRDGHRIMERGRYHLDFRHPAVIAHLNSVIERLIVEYGAKYFKFDYNIEHVLGTDIDCSCAGVGQALHGQAYLAWVRSILDRYPGLVLENCSSGAMRMEYDMLGTYTLQSTSDQQDPVLYAAIAAALPTAVLPEQGATWAYPQPGWSDEINVLTVANSLLGRVHLSGKMDGLSEHQLEDIVYEGMRVYKRIREGLREGIPFWPLGLPKWRNTWLALGMKMGEGKALVTVWKRGGTDSKKELPIKMGKGKKGKVTVLFPKTFEGEFQWLEEKSALQVEFMKVDVGARLLEVEFE